ncbi:26S proteasome non-ATPase regulatory subunit 9 [Pelomyxa schiedti]|nr:26S proteasome non-ATPase regulatory subunit 9 [Pelomyxa schiedti]
MRLVQRAREKMERREGMESDIDEVMTFLGDPAIMSFRVIDDDGFPSGDVDTIIKIKEAQQKCARLQNDHVRIMHEIEDLIVRLHQLDREADETTTVQTSAAPTLPPALAIVDEVSVGGPAYSAGFKVGDRILKFGSASVESCATVPNKLSAIGTIVGSSIGTDVEVKVFRSSGSTSRTLTLYVLPSKWSGSGVLGMHLSPVTGN